MRHRNALTSLVLSLTFSVALSASAVASDLLDQYSTCWSKAAVGKLDATPYKTAKQAEKAVMLSIDHADKKCVKLARRVWKTHGEAAWTAQHNYMMVQFSNANLQSYGW